MRHNTLDMPCALIIIGLIVLCLFYIKKTGSENMRSYVTAYKSGASQRFASELSSTDQRPYSIPRIQEIKDVGSMSQSPHVSKEGFADLDKYTKQEEELASYLYSGEGFTSPATLIENDLRNVDNTGQY